MYQHVYIFFFSLNSALIIFMLIIHIALYNRLGFSCAWAKVVCVFLKLHFYASEFRILSCIYYSLPRYKNMRFVRLRKSPYGAFMFTGTVILVLFVSE